MKILHLLYESRGDHFGIGGVGERAYQIYSHLKADHDITILCKKYPGAGNGTVEGLRHIYAGAESKSLTKTLLSYAYQAAVYVKEHGHKYDVIVEEFSPATPTFLHSCTRTPLILQVQGYTGGLYFKKYNPLYASVLCLLERFRPGLYRNFIFIDGHTRDRFCLPGKAVIRIIPNGVPAGLLEHPYTGGDYMLYLGRIDIFGKGLDLLLDAYRRHCEAGPAMDLVIAGDGRDMPRFRAMVAGLPAGIRGRIRLTGWVSGREKTETIRNASFLLLPSRHEVQGISVLEAMAAGKAVLTSDLPELSYVSERQAGVRFASGDPVSLASAMSEIGPAERRRQMGMNGREWVRHLSWENIAHSFRDFLAAVADTRSPK